jgi:acetyl esterase
MGNPPFHPDKIFQEILDKVSQIGNDLDHLTAQTVPALRLKREADARNKLLSIPIGSVRDTFVSAKNHQLPLRIYTPAGNGPWEKGKMPIVVFYHGGGWTLGSIATYDSIARTLANQIPAIVVSVDYRLAPEFPFPAGLEDANLALEWTVRNAKDLGGAADRIAVAGDSAGGNLATVVARKAKKSGIELVFQALVYPSTDIANTDYPSYVQ